jgi:uncharacterized integral membrane protein (TIGR00697 family)
MINELIFLFHTAIISLSSLIFFHLGSAALVTFICVQCLLANLFVLKQITLGGLFATASDAYTIGATLGLNLLQEYWGKEITRRAIYINMGTLILYTIVSQIHLAYLPCVYDTTQAAYTALLATTPRIVIASITVYFIAQMVDYYIYGFLKRWWHQRFLVLRTYSSTAISQLVDTVLFSFLGLYGIVDNIGHIIVVSYTIKLIAIIIASPVVLLAKRSKDTSTV